MVTCLFCSCIDIELICFFVFFKIFNWKLTLLKTIWNNSFKIQSVAMSFHLLLQETCHNLMCLSDRFPAFFSTKTHSSRSGLQLYFLGEEKNEKNTCPNFLMNLVKMFFSLVLKCLLMSSLMLPTPSICKMHTEKFVLNSPFIVISSIY